MVIRKRLQRCAVVFGALALLGACAGGSVEPTTTESAEVTSTEDSDATTPSTTTTEEVEEFNSEDYFADQTIRIVVNSGTGGGTDTQTRFIASFWGDYIPGTPEVAVTNLDGIAGANSVYSAPGDGFTLGASTSAQDVYVEADEPGAEYSVPDLRVVGALQPDGRAIILNGDLGYSQLSEAFGQAEPEIRYPGAIGGAENLGGSELLATWLCDRGEMACNMLQVSDDGASVLTLMMQRDEVDLMVGGLVSRVRAFEEGLAAGDQVLAAVADTGGQPEMEVPEGVTIPPQATDQLPDDLVDEYQRLLPAVGRGGASNVLWAPPSTPDEVIQALSHSLVDLFADDEFVAEFSELQGGLQQGILDADTAGAILQENASIYVDNQDFYTELQTEFWERYWQP